MEFKYDEIKEDATDIYESLHVNAKYSLKDTFYAFLDDYEANENYSKSEETSLYVSFCTLLIEKNENFEFLKDKLINLISDKNIEEVTKELDSDDYTQFLKDVNRIKKEVNIDWMTILNYLKAKKLTLEDYENFIEDEGFSPSQAIAATFEDSVLMIKKVIKFTCQLW